MLQSGMLVFERLAALARHGLGGLGWAILVILCVLILPLLWRVAAVWASDQPHWSNARWDSADLAPDPAQHKEPVIQFYAARTYRWRGILGVPTWGVFKPPDAPAYTPHQVVRS